MGTTDCIGTSASGTSRHRSLIPVLDEMLGDHTPVPGRVGTVGDEARRSLDWINEGSKRPFCELMCRTCINNPLPWLQSPCSE